MTDEHHEPLTDEADETPPPLEVTAYELYKESARILYQLTRIADELHQIHEYYNNEQLHQQARIVDALEARQQPTEPQETPQQPDTDESDDSISPAPALEEMIADAGHPKPDAVEIEHRSGDVWSGYVVVVDGYIDNWDEHTDALKSVGFEFNSDFEQWQIDAEVAEGDVLNHYNGGE